MLQIGNEHSIIFPYFMSWPVIPTQTTSLIAESGCYDDCIPPLLLPIVPAAYKPSLHSQNLKYNKYNGNPIKKPYDKKCINNMSWKCYYQCLLYLDYRLHDPMGNSLFQSQLSVNRSS